MDNNLMARNQYILSSGALLGGANMALLLILYSAGILFTSNWSNLTLFIFIGILFYAVKNYRDRYLDGFISYGKSIAVSVRISMLSGFITGFFYFLLVKVFDPSIRDILIAEAEEAYLAMGLSESFVEQNQENIVRGTSPWMLLFSQIINSLLLGLIISLITSIFIKRKGDPFQEAMKDVE